MAQRLFDKKMNDRGSALLTVILVVGFLTILATTLLYVSGMNFQTKQADYQNKKNFYSGEVALEQIRADLMADASEAAVEAYNDITMKYIRLQTGDMRRLEYNKVFVAKLQEKLVPNPLTDDNWEVNLSHRYTAGATLKLDDAYDANGDGIFTSAELLEVHEAEGYIRIRGIKMTYIDPDTKLTTIISTDLDVRAPEINWDATGSLDALEAGVTQQMAAESRDTVDPAKCVKYANWKKE